MTPQQIKQLRYGHVELCMTGSREYPTIDTDCLTCNICMWNVNLPEFCRQCISERVGIGNARLCAKCKKPISHSEYVQGRNKYCQPCTEIIEYAQIMQTFKNDTHRSQTRLEDKERPAKLVRTNTK